MTIFDPRAAAAARSNFARASRARLMLAASASILTLFGPSALGVYGGGRARAQALPSGCTDGDNDIAEAGETVTCLPPPSPIGELSTNVDDLTINIGSASTAAAIEAPLLGPGGYGVGYAVKAQGNGTTTINVLNAGSSVTGSDYSAGVLWRPLNSSATANLVLNNEGSIYAPYSSGVYAKHAGPGSISITNSGSISAHYGIGLFIQSGSGNVDVNSTGSISSGDNVGAYIIGDGGGVFTVSVANASGNNPVGGGVTLRGADEIDFTSTGLIEGGVRGIDFGSAVFRVNNMTGRSAFYVGAATTSLTIASTTPGSGAVGNLDITEDVGSSGVIDVDIHDAGEIDVRSFGDGDISVTSTGAVSAHDSAVGVYAYGTGGGAVTVEVNDATSSTLSAVYVLQQGSGALSVTATGAVLGNYQGIETSNTGLGVTNITLASGATVTGHYLEGVRATSTNASSNITVQGSSGDIAGATDGIYLSTAGADITVQNLDSVTGQTDDGIDVRSNGGDITISNVGTILGTGSNGIFADSDGGGISIQGVGLVGGVTGTGANGIYANSGAGDIDIGGATAVGDVSGAEAGIYARSTTGDITIASSGNIASTGINYRGVDVLSTGGGDISITTVDASGYAGGIRAEGSGGALSVTSTGTVSANSGIGTAIFTRNTGAGSTTISVADVQVGAGSGINAQQDGTGDLTVIATGTVTSGGASGINTVQLGSGALSITANAVSGAGGGGGIYAATLGSGLDISVSGAVSGATTGIEARNYGVGVTDITLASSATVTGQGVEGIRATSTNAASNITVQGSSGDIVGATDGIYISTAGADITVQNLDSVTGQAGSGLDLRSNGGDIVITNIGTIDGQNGAGIDANSGSVTGSGSISIQGVGLVGGVTGAFSAGILARAQVNDYRGDINIGGVTPIGAVTSNNFGVFAVGRDITINAAGDINSFFGAVGANGTEAISITLGNAVSTNFGAVNAQLSADGTDISITSTGLASGGVYGIVAYNLGTGATTINVNDVASGLTDAIYAVHYGAGALSVTVNGTVQGAQRGISTRNTGLGVTDITLASSATIIGDAVEGVRAVSTNAASNITVQGSSGDITGATDGIYLSTNGADITVQNLDSVTGRAGDGIDVRSKGGDITIANVGTISGVDNGIIANSSSGSGIGAISIQGVGLVGGIYSYSGAGIRANAVSGANRNDIDIGGVTPIGAITTVDGDGVSALGRNVTINVAGDVNAYFGVFASSTGSASITVGNVTSTYAGAVFVRTETAGTDLSITSTGQIIGGWYGVYAENKGSGDLSIDVVDVAGGAGYYGVLAKNEGANLSVTATGAVSGGTYGVLAINYGAGALDINVKDVTGQTDDGIEAANFGTDLSITATGTVTGAYQGIDAYNFGSGALSITANNVTALAGGDDAIDAYNSVDGTTLSVTTTGVISSAEDDGIDVVNLGGDLSISVASGSVTGYEGGIEAYNYGTGVTSVTIAGAVEGETELGVYAVSINGSTVTIESGGSVTGATGAITTDSAVAPGDAVDDTVTVNAGGSVSGAIRLLAGADTFNDAGGTFTTVYGGDGVDTVNFSGAGRTINGSGGAGDSRQEFEIFNFTSGGFELAGTHVGLDAVNFLAGANSVSGSLGATTTTIAAGASLDAADGASFSGALVNNGALSLGGDAGATATAGSFEQGVNGALTISANDLLVVSGDVTLGGELTFANLSVLSPGSTTSIIIDGGTGLVGTFDVVSSGVLIGQSVEYDLANFDVLLTTTINPASTIAGLNDNQSNVGDYLIGLLSDPNLDPALLDFIFAIGLNPDTEDLATILDNLTPEDIDQAMQFLSVSQRDFMRSLLNLGSSGDGFDLASRNVGVRFASLNGGAAVPDSDEPFAWVSIDGAKIKNGSTNANHGFGGRYFQFRGGVGGIGKGSVKFGLAAAYSDYQGDAEGPLGDDVDAETFSVAGTLGAPLAFGRIDSVAAYSAGDADIKMRLIDPVSAQTIVQTGTADISSYSLRSRLTFDGVERPNWLLAPHIQAGVTRSKLSDMTAGTGVSAINVQDSKNLRGDVGLGASYYRKWSDILSLHATATGVRYFGDTENSFASQFALAPAGGGSFATVGAGVKWQAEIETGLAWNVGDGFKLNMSAFSELGDLTVYGGQLGVSRNF
ncbi:MAG: hypothetical protein H6848_10935 [Caulobacterales bacterium]|nr:hypothetical protein [Caulobacterales bacterium]